MNRKRLPATAAARRLPQAGHVRRGRPGGRFGAATAVTRAEAGARKAGVRVRWLVADVLAPPKLEPFDFLFDRGCYHHVRRVNAAGFVDVARRLSHAGSRFLILAGSANETRRGGPPRIKESEIRGDFSESLDFQHLREIRFDSRDPNRKGALAWSALLRRRDEKKSVKQSLRRRAVAG
jgi:hypothetical protein